LRLILVTNNFRRKCIKNYVKIHPKNDVYRPILRRPYTELDSLGRSSFMSRMVNEIGRWQTEFTTDFHYRHNSLNACITLTSATSKFNTLRHNVFYQACITVIAETRTGYTIRSATATDSNTISLVN